MWQYKKFSGPKGFHITKHTTEANGEFRSFGTAVLYPPRLGGFCWQDVTVFARLPPPPAPREDPNGSVFIQRNCLFFDCFVRCKWLLCCMLFRITIYKPNNLFTISNTSRHISLFGNFDLLFSQHSFNFNNVTDTSLRSLTGN